MGEVIGPGVLGRLFWRRKWFILLGSLVCSAPALYLASVLPIRYTASGLLIAESAVDKSGEVNDRLTISDILHSPTLLNNVANELGIARQPNLIPQYRLTRAATMAKVKLQNLVATLKSVIHANPAPIDPSDAAIRYLQSHLTIGSKDNSRVLKIDFAAGDPQIAAAVVNELMHQFIAYDLAARRNDAESNYRQLMDHADAAQQEAAEADLRVQQFQAQNNVVTLQAGMPAALQFSAQQASLAAAKLDLSQAETAFDSSLHNVGSLSSPALQLLGDHETEVLERIARAGAKGSLNSALNDELSAVRAQITAETRKALASLAAKVDVARNRVASLQVAVDDSQTNANRSGNAQLALAQLSREADTKHSVYQSLLIHAEDAHMAVSQTSARIVSSAVSPLTPEPSRGPMIVALGFICGALLTLTAILVRSLFWTKVNSAKSLATITGMPGLGSLPYFSRSRRLKGADSVIIDGQSLIAETLRGMRLAIQDMIPGGCGAVVLITSAKAGEGKTTVAAALARRTAGDGLRVLLVEADLRRPRLCQMLGLLASPTLENGLLNNSTLDAMVQIDPRSGLHCIIAMGNHPNPISLLGSERFNAVMAASRVAYDLVIIDSPPVLRVSDAILLSRWADTIVFAVRAESTGSALVMEALSRFPEQSQSRVVTLLTRAPISRHDHQGYFSGYGTGRPKTVWNDAPAPAMNTLRAVDKSAAAASPADRPSQMH